MRLDSRQIVVAGAVVIGAAGWWLTSARLTRVEPSRVQPIAVASPLSTELPAAAATETLPSRTESTTERDVAKTPSVESDDPILRWLRDPSEGTLVEGTVTVIDADDREHTDDDGSFTVIGWRDPGSSSSGRRGAYPTVQVQAGRFRLNFPAGHYLGIASLELGGRAAFVLENPDRSPPAPGVDLRNRWHIVEGEPLRLVARWARPVILHVVDSRSRAELDHVTVRRAPMDWRTQDADHPGSLQSAGTVVREARSPIELARTAVRSQLQWRDSVWVHAASRTWERVAIDFYVGGDITRELEPAADLEVTLIGTIPEPPPTQRVSFDHDESIAVLRLRPRGGGTVKLEAKPAAKGPTRFEGLRGGAYSLTLERGQFWNRPQVLGRTEVELVEGTTARTTLVIEPPQDLRRVPLGGTVRISPDWNCTWFDLRFEPVDVPNATSLETRGLEMNDLTPVEGDPAL